MAQRKKCKARKTLKMFWMAHRTEKSALMPLRTSLGKSLKSWKPEKKVDQVTVNLTVAIIRFLHQQQDLVELRIMTAGDRWKIHRFRRIMNTNDRNKLENLISSSKNNFIITTYRIHRSARVGFFFLRKGGRESGGRITSKSKLFPFWINGAFGPRRAFEFLRWWTACFARWSASALSKMPRYRWHVVVGCPASFAASCAASCAE